MKDLLEFLTSPEIMIVYVIAGLSCLLCFIVYLVEKNNVKYRQKHNTRELNKLVEQIKEETQEDEENKVIYEEPVLQTMDASTNVQENIVENKEVVEGAKSVEVAPVSNETIRDEVIVEPLAMNDVSFEYEEPKKEEIELEYTDIEPDQATAQLELKKLTEELKKQEELREQENVQLTNYEEAQEENAIISLEELVKKSKSIYEANELTQYVDEGNAPITLQELEKSAGKNVTNYDEPFILENVVPKEVKVEETPAVVDTTPRKSVTLVDFNSAKVENTGKQFKSSPIISPIFGIERNDSNDSDLQLENTADYDKLDAEIKKTNEFLMTLKELQKKLD